MRRAAFGFALALLLGLGGTLSGTLLALNAARPTPWRCGPCRYVGGWARDVQARHDRAVRIWPHLGGRWPSYARVSGHR